MQLFRFEECRLHQNCLDCTSGSTKIFVRWYALRKHFRKLGPERFELMGVEPPPQSSCNPTICKVRLLIPEQFTAKAHPALFEGREEGGEPKNEALLF